MELEAGDDATQKHVLQLRRAAVVVRVAGAAALAKKEAGAVAKEEEMAAATGEQEAAAKEEEMAAASGEPEVAAMDQRYLSLFSPPSALSSKYSSSSASGSGYRPSHDSDATDERSASQDSGDSTMSGLTGVVCYAESGDSETSARSSSFSGSQYVPSPNAKEEDSSSEDDDDAAHSAAAVVCMTDTVAASRPNAVVAADKADMVAATAKAMPCAQYVADVWTIDWETAFEEYAAYLERVAIQKWADVDGAAAVTVELAAARVAETRESAAAAL